MSNFGIDENRLRWVKDPASGERLPVENDAAFLDAIIQFHRHECAHPERRVMRVRVAGGGFQVRECCTSCGFGFGPALKQSDKAWVATLPIIDAGTADNYASRRRDEEHTLLLNHARRQVRERGLFTRYYREYLASPAWKALRQKVIHRSGNLCEGCGERPVDEVHHTTYEHFGREFLFELLGLCEDCHHRVHADERVPG